MRNEVSVNKVKQDAEDMFRRGDFYCSESIIKSVKDNFAIDMPDEIIAMASGFPVGIGKSKCVCGAVSGGVMALGYFLAAQPEATLKSRKHWSWPMSYSKALKITINIFAAAF